MTTRRLAAILAADVVGFSALMGKDEEGTLARIKALRRDVIEPKVGEHHGRIFKTTGDGFLVEFSSPVEAVRCAVGIQEALARDAAQEGSEGLQLRIGINLGDIIVEEDGDVYGDGVNLTSRIEQLASAGGVCASAKVYEEVRDKVPYAFQDLGEQRVKNIERPVRLYQWQRGRSAAPQSPELRQEIRYCRAPDGVRLAWARVGSGLPIVKTANWLNHLEYDWESPLFRPFFERLANTHTLIRYDARGNGLSDWEVPELSLDAWVSDLKTVVDAAGIDRFPLIALSQGCAVSVVFAARYPERVSHLVLCGGFALGGRKQSPEMAAKRDAMASLMRLGWGADEPIFRQLFTSQLVPDATKEQAEAFNELQRRSTSPECAVRYYQTVGDLDVREFLANVRAPTLVMHVRGDLVAPLAVGRTLAAGIPNARFVTLEGRNHILQEHDPGFARFFEELALFLGE